MVLINKVVMPIRIKKVTKMPIMKYKAYFQLFSSQNENRYKNTNIIPATMKLALRDFTETDLYEDNFLQDLEEGLKKSSIYR